MKKLAIKETKSIRRILYGNLWERIVRNEIAPGERLVETKLAQEAGASRTPVREALQDLEREGLIENIPRVGYIVRSIDKSELDEICAIRIVLEGLAASWAIEKSHKRLVRELRKNIALCEEKISSGDVTAFVDLGAQFHETIARMSKSTRILELTQLLRRHMLRYRVQSVYRKEQVVRAITGHRAIVDAIERSDTEAVTLAVKSHIMESKADILRFAFGEEPGDNDRAVALNHAG
jgi:DNA-binding GntR family transcriptional regulator